MQENGSVQKNCFFISPIGTANSDVRRRSDQILKHIIKPACQECGYAAIRADEIDNSGMISTQILERILNDGIVIADLTDQNPNVFYELAVRHAVRKPFIQIIAEGQSIPFDVQGIRTIEVDHQDLDSAASARESITKAIRAIDEGQPVDTPMTYTLNLQDLRSSGTAEERGMAEILDIVQNIQRQVRRPSVDRNTPDFTALRSTIEDWALEGKITTDDLVVLERRFREKRNSLWIREMVSALSNSSPPHHPGGGFSSEPPF
ncbi:hypothetical protein JHN59_33585 [Streptomyces sp. MBT49]|uniref:hypothetical protein n=1 Tax=Streptomyces sp. MBT49 TaxID=1488380 RepID=UPI00190AD06F|nr:hypothetical protein [Streptomyces sp. MBT49]MBK3629661.1 hypothetical protein [Streptomyces sp. MBT49]